jgi:hypothetical protein
MNQSRLPFFQMRASITKSNVLATAIADAVYHAPQNAYAI